LILSSDDIWNELNSGSLIFEPGLEDDQVRESSIDLKLGREFHRWMTVQDIEREPSSNNRRIRLDLPEKEFADKLQQIQKEFTKESHLTEEGFFPLQPGDFVLAPVEEYVYLPRYLGGRIEGRTRFARLGLEIHSTAPTIRAGWDGRIMLELKNVGPLIFELYPGARICQLILERVLTPPSKKLESGF
jgi:dCTP deaminase